jgi:hypothetical protein
MISSFKSNTSNAGRSEFIRIELLFNSIEVELARRWAHGEVPTMFTSRPVDDLRKMVKAWWQIYHEGVTAASGHNRTVWERNQAYAAVALDTPALLDALSQVRQRINLDALSGFRPIHQAEHSAIGILDQISAYYTNLNNQIPT